MDGTGVHCKGEAENCRAPRSEVSLRRGRPVRGRMVVENPNAVLTNVVLNDGTGPSANGKRRRQLWSEDEKRRIVAEAAEPGASVSVVARRHDVNATPN